MILKINISDYIMKFLNVKQKKCHGTERKKQKNYDKCVQIKDNSLKLLSCRKKL